MDSPLIKTQYKLLDFFIYTLSKKHVYVKDDNVLQK